MDDVSTQTCGNIPSLIFLLRITYIVIPHHHLLSLYYFGDEAGRRGGVKGILGIRVLR